jgi:hypothetical protein
MTNQSSTHGTSCVGGPNADSIEFGSRPVNAVRHLREAGCAVGVESLHRRFGTTTSSGVGAYLENSVVATEIPRYRILDKHIRAIASSRLAEDLN